MLVDKVKKYITENSLVSKDETILVGFSGGADSMCLLHILKTLSYKVSAIHINHGIRGIEAERDQKAAEEFCKYLSIPFYLAKTNIPEIAKREGVSEETAGRNERYRFFNDFSVKYNIDKIATAHNKNDNAETLIMHILRGTGPNGLAGIPVKRDNIIRPLLCCSRDEIEHYCKIHNLPYVTDSTNFQTEYMRNKVRHNILPLLTEYNPNILNSVINLSEMMSADKDYFNGIIKNIIGNNTQLDIRKLKNLDKAILFRAVTKIADNAGISYEYSHIKNVVDIIMSNISGKRVDLIGGFIEISCGKVSALTTLPNKFSYKIGPLTEIKIGEYFVKSDNKILSDINFHLPLNADVEVRSRRAGDKIKVRGMTKKISDIFTDKKIPASKRDEIPILTLNGEILYIFGIDKSDTIMDLSNNTKSFVLNISNKEYTNE